MKTFLEDVLDKIFSFSKEMREQDVKLKKSINLCESTIQSLNIKIDRLTAIVQLQQHQLHKLMVDELLSSEEAVIYDISELN